MTRLPDRKIKLSNTLPGSLEVGDAYAKYD